MALVHTLGFCLLAMGLSVTPPFPEATPYMYVFEAMFMTILILIATTCWLCCSKTPLATLPGSFTSAMPKKGQRVATSLKPPNAQKYIYCDPTEQFWHERPACGHLDKKKKVLELRPCSSCSSSFRDGPSCIYIAPCGKCWHENPSCGHLKLVSKVTECFPCQSCISCSKGEK